MPANEGSSDKEKSLELFLNIGLDERTAKNTVANNKVTANLIAVIHEVRLNDFFFLVWLPRKKKRFFFSVNFSFFFF